MPGLVAPLVDPIQSSGISGATIQPFAQPQQSTGGANIANATAGALQKVNDVMTDQANTAVLLGQQKGLDDWEASNLYDPNNGALKQRGQNALGITQTKLADFDKWSQGQSDNLSNNEQQLSFQKMAQSRRTTIERTLENHEGQQIDNLHVDTAKAASDSAVNRAALYFNQPDVVNSSIDAAKAAQVSLGHFQGLPDEMIANNVLNVESNARLGVLTRMSDNNPQGAVDYYHQNVASFNGSDSLAAQRLIEPTQRKVQSQNLASKVLAGQKPAVDQTGVINFVMNNLEGGDKLITDNNGAQAKFGINAAANTDVDVPNLTSDEASQIYVQRYWSKIKGDELPATMRLPAMSFAVTSGTGPANDLLQKSGGDPRKFQELAAAYYQDLATKNPEKYAASLPGWMNRMANVNQQIDYMRGQLPNIADMNNQIDAQATDPIVAADAKTLVKSQIDAVKEAQTNDYQAASKEAWQYKTNGQEVPPSVVSRMNPKEAEEMQANAPPDPTVYETARQQILSGQNVDLSSLRWRLGKKYDDLVELKADPVKQAQNSVVDNAITKALPAIIGKKTVDTTADYDKASQFRNAVQSDIMAQEKSSGKRLTPNEVQGTVDKMFLKGNIQASHWYTLDGQSGKAYTLSPGRQPVIDSIPATGQHYVGGSPVSSSEVLTNIVKQLRNQGMAVTDNNVTQAYQRLVKTNQIKYVSQ